MATRRCDGRGTDAEGGTARTCEALITGSWRLLVYRNPDVPEGQIDKAAFVLCAVMHLHHALRDAMCSPKGPSAGATNTAAQFVGGRLQWEKLGAVEEPPLMKKLRALIDGMLPRLTFPSCRWRCSTAPACGFRSFMTVMHHAWM
ncbi:hypothetical protein ACGFJC_48850 [Nonomuraea fuscirosea]|uniref:hypothetical protein n=1 Tax=Nonomuraea fuscirosea TaxID=1291556 RepID=UPI0034832144